MEKTTIERLVARRTGTQFSLTHKGNHRWDSEPVATSQENSGAFHAMFSTVAASVQAHPCGPGHEDWNVFRLSLNWTYREGGTNGATLDLFYYAKTGELLTRAEADAKYWSSHK